MSVLDRALGTVDEPARSVDVVHRTEVLVLGSGVRNNCTLPLEQQGVRYR